MNITSKIEAVTLFPRGAEITRLARIELEGGEQQIILRDLPEGLMENSLRVEGRADDLLSILAVDSRTVHVPREVKRLEAGERRDIRKQIEKLEDEMRNVEGRSQTATTQKNLMDALAAMPGSPRSPKTDWGKIFELIGERLPGTHETINQLVIERRELQKKIDNLAASLADVPVDPERRFEVVISAKAQAPLSGELTIRYQIAAAGWEPFYDGRLVTDPREAEPELDLVRRAQIHQQTGEAWDEVTLSLSTTRPSGGTGAPGLSSKILDILPEHPPVAMAAPVPGVMRKTRVKTVSAQMDSAEAGSMPEPEMMRAVQERESEGEQSGFQAVFKVPGRASLQGDGTQKKVRLGGQKLRPQLQVRSTPLRDPTAYLHATFKLDDGLALLPGQISLYRDNVYVGNGRLPLINVGETHELGFGADDQVTIKRVEQKRSKGRHGLIKSENTDEFRFKISLTNHHDRAMSVRILDRIPASRHEKLKVEEQREMSEPSERDVDDQRGVLAFEHDLPPGGNEVIHIHYRLSWPADERIG